MCPFAFQLRFCLFVLGKNKPININILDGTMSGTNGTPSLGQREPISGTNWDPSLGQTGRFLFTSTVKLGRLSRKGCQKNVYVFSVYCFFFFPPPLVWPPKVISLSTFWGSKIDPKSGRTNNSPVAKLIAFNLLLAAVRRRF